MANKNNRMAAFVGIGFEIVGLLVFAVLFGDYLDTYFAAKGLITAGLVVLALTGWVIHVVVMLRGFEKDTEGEQ
jgi:hypothetical protein